ncbi:MAG: nucleotidyltransferase domain-containing protein [Candidatus Woesearchaeota archaeon]
MKTEIKIIKSFIENKKSKTIREISKIIKSDYKITNVAVQRLIEKKIILAEPVGKSLLCSLNDNYFGLEVYQAEIERKEFILKINNIKQLLQEIMDKTKTSMFVFLLFGSYVKQQQTKNSDIDIMFISNDNKFESDVNEALSLIPLKIHALFFTEEEFIRMKDSKKSNVIKEAIERNIILHNIESYYRLKNA